jgi:iron complex transport system ATP-binding protein
VTHALLLAEGRVSACGPAPDILADDPLSRCFGVPVSVSRADGRWAARATPSW